MTASDAPVESFAAAVLCHAGRPTASAIRAIDRNGEIASLNYPQLAALAGGLAHRLNAAGIGAGDRVALVMASKLTVVLAVTALFAIGATVVPLAHHRIRPASYQFDITASALRAARPSCILLTADVVETYRPVLAVSGGPRLLCLDDLVGTTADLPLAPRTSDPRVIQFSSGTTQAPKGIMLGEDSLLNNVSAICQRIAASAADHLYLWLPLSHDMGLVGGLLSALYAGGSLTMTAPADFIREPLGWAEGITRHKCTLTVGPPSAYALLVAKATVNPEHARQLDLSSLRLAMTGAEMVPPALGCAFQAAFSGAGLRPHVLQPCYGLAENCVAVTLRPPGRSWKVRHFVRAALSDSRIELRAQAGSDSISRIGNGEPIVGTEIRIGRADGDEIVPAPYGELFVRGRSAANGILDEAGRRAAMLGGGWIATGDLAALVEGELFVLGRIKELIKYGGQSFAPTDIEAAVAATTDLPAQAVAAVASHDELGGQEALVIFVEIARGEANPALAAAIRQKVLAAFRVPTRDVVFLARGGLPRTPSGKIRRIELAAAYVSRA
jgi:acyl-CoA synthetase (AMP-forming)/AMP-acid ligase II